MVSKTVVNHFKTVIAMTILYCYSFVNELNHKKFSPWHSHSFTDNKAIIKIYGTMARGYKRDTVSYGFFMQVNKARVHHAALGCWCRLGSGGLGRVRYDRVRCGNFGGWCILK